MALTISTEPSPLHVDATGTIRVGATRVTLDTLVAAFQRGATAEQIAQDYPVLPLDDIYFAIGYYLRHRDEIDGYLAERQREAGALREQIQAASNLSGLRERLIARRHKPQAG